MLSDISYVITQKRHLDYCWYIYDSRDFKAARWADTRHQIMANRESLVWDVFVLLLDFGYLIT